jgi:predicted peroxiredoxin
MKKPVFVLALLMALLTAFAATSAHADDRQGLFINLTTDDTWSASKAIFFAHHRVLKSGYEPVAIWLNVRGIYLADKKRASDVHGPMAEQGQSIQDMLRAFMEDGGRVIACAACSRAAGLTSADFIEGVEMGSPDLVLGILFDPNVKTLAW